MGSVTNRVKEIIQPYSGYLPVKMFKKNQLTDGNILYDNENIHPSLIGMVVDYLTRFMIGQSLAKSFDISLSGAKLINKLDIAKTLLNKIKGLDDESIINACKLVGFDVCFRSSPAKYVPIERINPDKDTINNIRIMVNRSLSFFEKYGPVTFSELTFEGGYTNIVTSGDGDFMTKDTLWDFKVSNSNITSKHTLQILMYYLLGVHSIHEEYKDLLKLGFFNPRLNVVYLCDISEIDNATMKEVEEKVIGYGVVNENEELTVNEISLKYGIEKSVLYKEIRSGKLIATKKKNKYYIEKVNLENYFKLIEENRHKITTIFIIVITLMVISIFLIAIICGITLR